MVSTYTALTQGAGVPVFMRCLNAAGTAFASCGGGGAGGSYTGDGTTININGSNVISVISPTPVSITGSAASVTGAVSTSQIDLSTVTAALALKQSSTGAISTSRIDLSTVTAALSAKADDNTVVHLAQSETISGAKDFRTVSSSMTIKGSEFGVGASSFTVSGGSATVAYLMTARAFSGDGSGITGVNASFAGGAVANATTFASSVTINDGTAGGLLVSGDSVTASAFFGDGSHLTGVSASFNGGYVANETTFGSSVTNRSAGGILVKSGGIIASSGSFTNGITASSGTFTAGDVKLNSGGIVASSGSFTAGVTASSLTITGGNIKIPMANGISQGTSGSTMSVSGLLIYISSTATALQGASTFTAVNTATNFSTFTLLANTLGVGDSLEVECAFKGKGTLTTPFQAVHINTPNITVNSALVTNLSWAFVRAHINVIDTNAMGVYGNSDSVSSSGTSAYLGTISGGASPGQIAFDTTADQIFHCQGKVASGGTVDFMWMRVRKY